MLTVGQVVDRLGLRPSTLHFYERRGLLPPVPRVRGQRRYDESHLRRLAMIGIGRQAGLSLDQITVLLTAQAPQWRRMVSERLRGIDAELARLARARQTLAGSLRCPADHPADACPHVQGMIDDYLTSAAASSCSSGATGAPSRQ
jgi:DNA-binding transcriptional MerR regulator